MEEQHTAGKPATAGSVGFKLSLPSPVMPQGENHEMQETHQHHQDGQQHPPPTAFSTQTSQSVADDDSGMFTFNRPGSRAGSQYSYNPSYFAGSRQNTGIGISYGPPGTAAGAAGGLHRPLTTMVIPEESGAEAEMEEMSPAAALAAAYRVGKYRPGTALTGNRSIGTPVIELDEQMRQAAERELHAYSDPSTPATGKSDYDYVTKEEAADLVNPYENMDPEELLKMAEELGLDEEQAADVVAEEEEDSPFAEVRASVSNYDDPDIPCLTFRAMVLGTLFTVVGAALNTYFSLRYPAPLVTPMTIQVLSYPFGVFMARYLPTHVHQTPKYLVKLGMDRAWSMNPGPFNIKEHTVIIIMANVGIAPALSVSLVMTFKKHFGVQTTFLFDVLLLLTTQTIGFSFAGLCRRFLVWPAALIWPQTLVTCTLLNTFHAEDDDGADGSLSRFRYFLYVLVTAALWYFVPGFLFIGLSAFSWMCWILPTSPVVNQLFGVMSGLGMGCLTFDWSQISYIGSPLIVPWWAISNIVIGFVALYWILTPIIYYTNTMQSAYMPISVNGVFDRYGQEYNTSRILTPELALDIEAYNAYSPLYFPTTYVLVYLIAFALTTSMLVHTALYYGPTMWKTFKNIRTAQTDIHAKLMLAYREVPSWWYIFTLVAFLAMAIGLIQGYQTELPLWGVLLSLVLPAIYLVPSGFIYALANQQTSINILSELVIGYILPGKPIANALFKIFSAQPLQNGLYFVQDLKLGHYMKVPPRTTFAVQIFAVVVAAFIQAGMLEGLDKAVPDLCNSVQAQSLSCPTARTLYNAAVIWGTVGPARLFSRDSPYRGLLYGILAGAIAPIPAYLLAKRFKSSFLDNVNIPVMLSAVVLIPPATGINFSSWGLVGFVFQFLLRRRRFRWWSKYNFVTSAALDSGTVFGVLLVFLLLQLPKGGSLSLNWWGNTVFMNTFDADGVPFKTAPQEGFGRAYWT